MSKENQSSFLTHVKDILSEYPDAETCWIAYSGGLDSHVLLHVLAAIKTELKLELIAVYINHGISPCADQWQEHCRHICENYGMEFRSYSVEISQKTDQGIEALAREKRYEIFGDLMKTDDLLLTAHHLNDQVETMLLQLLRGSGPDGLVGMPQSRKFSAGYLLRPLLAYAKEYIHEYAFKESLYWVEDESNESNDYDRNFLRNKILPELFTHWPGALKTIQRAIAHQVDAKELIHEIATADLLSVCENDFAKINLQKFDALSCIRKKYVLRAWIKKNKLKIPNVHVIDRIIQEVILAHTDRNPGIEWHGAEIRRYREYLYIMPALPAHDVQVRTPWNMQQTLQLTSGILSATSIIAGIADSGIRKDMLPEGNVEVRYRQGGEKIRLPNREHTHDLKKLFQETGVLPWLRERIPLIYYEDILIAVGDLWIEHKYAATASEPAWQIKWQWSNA